MTMSTSSGGAIHLRGADHISSSHESAVEGHVSTVSESDGFRGFNERRTIDPEGQEYFQSQGVTRMEALYRTTRQKAGRGTLWAVSISIVVCAWAYALDSATTSHYAPFATSSFGTHSSGLAALAIASNIVSAVCKPFVAKLSDITSRPYTYTIILAFYVVGYIVVATSPSIQVFISGVVLVSIGSSGMDLLNGIIVGDLTTLEWRGFVGAILSLPFVINTWFSGKIVEAFSEGERWRWGYAMFAIIMPIVLGPAILTLIHLERKAQKEGVVNIASSNAARRRALEGSEEEREGLLGAVVAKAVGTEKTWFRQAKHNLEEIDAIGLVLLGLGWGLVLLPFVSKNYANGGLANPRIILAMILGALSLVAYILYERYISRIPSAPKRLLVNRTFISAVIIDFFYFFSGQLRGLYFESYILIVKTWSVQNVTYFNNIMTISLSLSGIVVGIIHRFTHRYKYLQIVGLVIKIFGIAVILGGHRTATTSSFALIASQILIGIGGACSVVGTRVSSQASVPHQDLALTLALLALWTKIGSALGAASASLIWSEYMPILLRRYLPEDISDEKVHEFFGNIRAIRAYDFDHPVRQGAIQAYQETLWYLIVPALWLSVISLVAACFQTNFYLGKQQNAVMNVAPDGERIEEEDDQRED
ncbi:hypothetical protein E1B28_012709 [Marasmius oreades]|uniref:Uncharacterized protein n=1 Tax=Marasmius oreades TaxID=181124 RepID=A0A9P7UQ75_9AGAR|nr:uncharacterized protein E1B28_012709 [Marasmius oreades]KAG7088741.1 hypothetical protein E1B28_012709 [Marasmius oreades]